MRDLCTHLSTRKPSFTCTDVEDVEVTPKVWTKANRATPKKVHIQLSYAKALHTTAGVTVGGEMLVEEAAKEIVDTWNNVSCVLSSLESI